MWQGIWCRRFLFWLPDSSALGNMQHKGKHQILEANSQSLEEFLLFAMSTTRDWYGNSQTHKGVLYKIFLWYFAICPHSLLLVLKQDYCAHCPDDETTMQKVFPIPQSQDCAKGKHRSRDYWIFHLFPYFCLLNKYNLIKLSIWSSLGSQKGKKDGHIPKEIAIARNIWWGQGEYTNSLVSA